MQIVSSLVAGLLFGVGLIVSGMVNPQKVQNFLDLFGAWDPSLAFVMGGAVLVALPGFWLVRGLGKPIFGDRFRLPTRNDVDLRLVTGAAVFGIGWGLGGYCPGPALTALPLAASGTVTFVVAMLAGMAIARWIRPSETSLPVPAE